MTVQARDLADKALASFVVIQAALKRSRRLWAYCQREDLNQRIPNFAVSHCPSFCGICPSIHVHISLQSGLRQQHRAQAQVS